MKADGGWPRAGLVAVVFGVTSWLLAAAYVMLHSGFGRGDLRPFAVWAGLACVLAVVPLRLFGGWSVHWPFAITMLGAVCGGVVLGVAFTYALSLLLGPWMGAFSFPIFQCWAGGSTAALLLSAAWGDRRRLLSVSLLWPACVVALELSLQLANPTDPPEYVVLAPAGASLDQVQAIWDLFLAPSTATWHEYNPNGIRAVGAYQEGSRSGVRVTFHPGTDAARRAVVVDRAVASPLVAVVRELETRKGRQHERVLKDAGP